MMKGYIGGGDDNQNLSFVKKTQRTHLFTITPRLGATEKAVGLRKRASHTAFIKHDGEVLGSPINVGIQEQEDRALVDFH